MSKRPNVQETTGASAGIGVTVLALAVAAANGASIPAEFAAIGAAISPIVTYLVRLYRNRAPKITREEFDRLQTMIGHLVIQQQEEKARAERVAKIHNMEGFK